MRMRVVSGYENDMQEKKCVVVQRTWTPRRGNIAIRIVLSSNIKKLTPADNHGTAIPFRTTM